MNERSPRGPVPEQARSVLSVRQQTTATATSSICFGLFVLVVGAGRIFWVSDGPG